MGSVDAITLSVVWGGILAAAEEMGLTLRRTAYSEAVREGQDFSTALFDARGRMIAQGNFSPGHLGSMPFAVGHVLKEYPPKTLHHEDAILLNDLYMGSGHLPDIFTIYPVFYKGELAAFAVNVAHHIDVGGSVAGSQAVEGITEFYQEGIRLIPTRYQQGGVVNNEVMKFITSNVRVPDKVLGDLKAQTNANRIGARRMIELFDRYGLGTVKDCMDELLDRSEAAMREAIKNIPDGSGSFEDYMDDYGRDTEPIKVRCTVTVKGDSITIDYTGSSPQVPAGLNSPYNYTCAYAFCALKNVTDPSLPQNDGCLRPVKVVAPEGSFFNPRPPAGAGGRAIISQRNYEVVLGALSHLVPERVITAASHMANPVIGGYDPRRQRRFVHYVVGIGGFGARARKDGCEALASAFNVRNIPVEVDEINYPVVVERLELITDSAGAGKYRGGCGIRKDERMFGEDLRLSNLTDRVKFAPFGLFGGKPGARASVILNPGQGEQMLHSKGKYELRKGDLVSIRTSGCGGYGDPLEREPQAVWRDVIEGLVSLDRAREDYGVIIENDALDEKKTEEVRKHKGGRDTMEGTHDSGIPGLRHLIPGFQTHTQLQKDPLVICEADGIYYKDIHGKRYMDGLAGVFVVNVGHNSRRVIEAMREQLDRVAFTPPIQGTNPKAIELAELVAEITPAPLKVVQFTSGGSEAIETGIKMARHYHKATGNGQKVKFISRYSAYHGATLGALSASGKRKQKAPFEPLVPGFIQVHGPLCHRCPYGWVYPGCQIVCAAVLEDTIKLEGPETVAGIIVEPMMRRGGAAAPPPEYLPGLREICNRHNVLLIFDEVVTGFGRTGQMFAAQTFNTAPDILCLGKGISSGYAPLAATVITEEIAGALELAPQGGSTYLHGHTYGGNPVSCAAGIANIRVLMEEKLIENSEAMGQHLRERLEELRTLEVVGAVQGKGLLSGIEFVRDMTSGEQFPDELSFGFVVGEECQKRGLLLRPDVNEMAFSPPLIINKEQIDEMVEILRESIKAALLRVD